MSSPFQREDQPYCEGVEFCTSQCFCTDGVRLTRDDETDQVFDGSDVADQGTYVLPEVLQTNNIHDLFTAQCGIHSHVMQLVGLMMYCTTNTFMHSHYIWHCT